MDLSDHPAYRLVIDHARALGRDIAIEMRAELEEMDEPLLSGGDSRLISVWQEVCVQVQGEESFFWEQYQEMVVGIIGFRVSELSTTDKEMLWLATDAGSDWLYKVVNAVDGSVSEHPGVDTEAVADWIWTEFLQPLAENERDPNVVSYLEGEEWSGDDEGDLDDDDDDDRDEDPATDEDE